MNQLYQKLGFLEEILPVSSKFKPTEKAIAANA